MSVSACVRAWVGVVFSFEFLVCVAGGGGGGVVV